MCKALACRDEKGGVGVILDLCRPGLQHGGAFFCHDADDIRKGFVLFVRRGIQAEQGQQRRTVFFPGQELENILVHAGDTAVTGRSQNTVLVHQEKIRSDVLIFPVPHRELLEAPAVLGILQGQNNPVNGNVPLGRSIYLVHGSAGGHRLPGTVDVKLAASQALRVRAPDRNGLADAAAAVGNRHGRLPVDKAFDPARGLCSVCQDDSHGLTDGKLRLHRKADRHETVQRQHCQRAVLEDHILDLVARLGIDGFHPAGCGRGEIGIA